MSGRGYLKGHAIYHDGKCWRYVDTREPTEATWKKRPCGHCGLHDASNGHDACIANLPGVKNACCGHGRREEAYVMFDNGLVIRGFEIDSDITEAHRELIKKDGQ